MKSSDINSQVYVGNDELKSYWKRISDVSSCRNSFPDNANENKMIQNIDGMVKTDNAETIKPEIHFLPLNKTIIVDQPVEMTSTVPLYRGFHVV